MTGPNNEIRQPDGQEEAQQQNAGAPRESGTEATREAIASDEVFRLREEDLNERDARFTRARKEQGPPLAGPEVEDTRPAEERADDVAETPVPEPPS